MKRILVAAFAGSLCALAAAQDAQPPRPEDPTQPYLVPDPEAPAPDAPPASEPSWTEGWKGGIELGLNGSEGNTERFNFRAGANAGRKTERFDTKFGFVYSYGREDSADTENKFLAEGRNDWLFKNSPWRVFAKSTFEYDDFQDWDVRVTAHGGVGYAFIEDDKTLLLGRVGLGFAREFGGEDNAIKFEGLLGADFSRQLTEQQKISASVDYYPEIAPELGPYRIEAKAAYEILVDPETKMTLKLGVLDRYDSNPGEGFERNDFEYFALLAWSF